MTREAYERAIEIEQEIKQTEEELKFLSSNTNRIRLTKRTILGNYKEIAVSNDTLNLIRNEKEKKIEELKQEIRGLV